ncbi:MAG: hypothetical protein HYX62_01175 [Gammaproteobacteria bacterium]|nr:hypothetical protein [Gammaproteobacteria bacterium]
MSRRRNNAPGPLRGSLRAALENAVAVLPPLDVGPATPAGRRLATAFCSAAAGVKTPVTRH